MPSSKGDSLFGAKNLVRKVTADKGHRESTLQLFEGLQQTGFDISGSLVKIFQQVRYDFRIRLGLEPMPFLLQADSQILMVGDNAIVNDGKIIVARQKGMCVVAGDLPVCGPAGMSDPHMRGVPQNIFFLVNIAHAAHIFFDDDALLIHQSHAAGIVTPVLQITNTVEQNVRYIFQGQRPRQFHT